MRSIMDLCLSCLGLRKDEDESEETTHLLDGQNMQYGTTGMDPRSGYYVDPEEERRQREALERMVQETSERLINVAPLSTKPDLDKLAREDGPLFEHVFFNDVDKEEIRQGFQKLGSLNVAVVTRNNAPDPNDQRPIVFEFGL